MKSLFILILLFCACTSGVNTNTQFIISPKEISSPTATYESNSGRFEITMIIKNNTSHFITTKSFLFDFYSYNGVKVASLPEKFDLNISPGQSNIVHCIEIFANTEVPQKITIDSIH